MQILIYTRANDGGVTIVFPAPKEHIENSIGQTLSDMDYEVFVLANSEIPSDAKNVRWVTPDALINPEFRDAYCDINQAETIDIDMVKARQIALTNLRASREPLFAPLDAAYMIALEKNDTATMQSISSQKQALRDATNTLKGLAPSGYNDTAMLATLKAEMMKLVVQNG